MYILWLILRNPFTLWLKSVYLNLRFLRKHPYLQIGYLTYTNNSTFGKYIKVADGCFITNSSLSDYSYVSRGSIINNTTIGKFCSIGPNFLCGWGIHPTNGLSTSPMFYSIHKQNGMSLTTENKIEEHKPIKIENDVFIGANVTVLDGVKIGNGAIIGAGSVVNKNIPDYAIVGGVPAKVIRYRFNDEIIAKLLSIKWWTWEKERLEEVEKYFFDIEEFVRIYYKD